MPARTAGFVPLLFALSLAASALPSATARADRAPRRRTRPRARSHRADVPPIAPSPAPRDRVSGRSDAVRVPG
ncbi:hypothetical protein [Streptomyces sp. LARHCF252]